jgi:hypothetical protein
MGSMPVPTSTDPFQHRSRSKHLSNHARAYRSPPTHHNDHDSHTDACAHASPWRTRRLSWGRKSSQLTVSAVGVGVSRLEEAARLGRGRLDLKRPEVAPSHVLAEELALVRVDEIGHVTTKTCEPSRIVAVGAVVPETHHRRVAAAGLLIVHALEVARHRRHSWSWRHRWRGRRRRQRRRRRRAVRRARPAPTRATTAVVPRTCAAHEHVHQLQAQGMVRQRERGD